MCVLSLRVASDIHMDAMLTPAASWKPSRRAPATCGPAGMLLAFERAFSKAGLARPAIHRE